MWRCGAVAVCERHSVAQLANVLAIFECVVCRLRVEIEKMTRCCEAFRLPHVSYSRIRTVDCSECTTSSESNNTLPNLGS